MQALWRDDVASFDGEFVHIAPSWSWPKPAQPGGPPILIGGAPGPKLFAHVAEYADGWIPIGGAGVRAALRRSRSARARRAGRDPETLQIVPFGTVPDAGKLEYYESIGIDEVVLRLPGGPRDRVLPRLDRLAELVAVSAPALIGLDVAGDADAWRAAGFTVDADGACRLGHVRMQTGVGETRHLGLDARRRRRRWSRPCTRTARSLLDHLVVFTDDPDRTVGTLRRPRARGPARARARQRQHADVLPGGRGDHRARRPDPHGDGERLWGLSPTVADLDACARAARRPARADQGRDAARPPDRDAAARGVRADGADRVHVARAGARRSRSA